MTNYYGLMPPPAHDIIFNSTWDISSPQLSWEYACFQPSYSEDIESFLMWAHETAGFESTMKHNDHLSSNEKFWSDIIYDFEKLPADANVTIPLASKDSLVVVLLSKDLMSPKTSNAVDIEASKEGYKLLIHSQGIVLMASYMDGIRMGVQTVLQLVESLKLQNLKEIKCGIVTDSPRFPWRGCLLDSARHFQTVDFIEDFIKNLAYHKFNRFHWHLVDDQGWRIEIREYPKLTQIGSWRSVPKSENGEKYGGFYTETDIQRIVKFAHNLGVTIVPEIELPGHCMAALASYPELSCTGKQFDVPNTWGVFSDVYCAGKDSVIEFNIDVLKRVSELFPHSPYIHVGADEVPKQRWRQCQLCKQRMAKEKLQTPEQLQSWFINQIASRMSKMNKTIVAWDEVLEAHGIPEDTIVQAWRGHDKAVEAVNDGKRCIVSPTSHCYFDYPHATTDISKVYEFDPTPSGVPNDKHHLILGGECCMWSERAPQDLVYGKVYPRLVALSTVLWSYDLAKSSYNFQRFHSDLLKRHQPRLKARGIVSGDGLALPPKTTLPSKVFTNIPKFNNYHPECAFTNDEAQYFWSSRGPLSNEYFEITLDTPISHSTFGYSSDFMKVSIEVLTGLPMAPDEDRLESGAFHALINSEWVKVGLFNGSRFYSDIILKNGKEPDQLKAVKIICGKNQQKWLAIRKVELEPHEIQ